ncbi:hypothetical protein [Agathobaculum sp. Marseille-P7918]|uniref:hypothetical protein n=1 Tax=Agathobaculum sp. Marseille-P7918 TaxID=2479843 RepID=UPI000F636B74|nr:hypothetical protein [Agathobaculum sp. Marseille-P7918]
MNYKHCCVVGADGAYKTFVLVLLEQDEDGETTETVQGYKLAEGERLLDVLPPIIKVHAGSPGFVCPCWDEDAETWVEGATAEELSAWEAEHPAPVVDLDTLREAKQAANKKALADWLAAHPLTWTDGNVYGTTKEDQDEMALNYMQYQLAVSANQPAVLEWHTQKKRCYTFSVEDFTALSLAIAAYVYPYLRYQEAVKEAIYMAQSKEELDAIEIDYGSVGAAA